MRSRARGLRKRQHSGETQIRKTLNWVRQGQGREASGPFGDGLGWLQGLYMLYHTHNSSSNGNPGLGCCRLRLALLCGCRKCVHAHMQPIGHSQKRHVFCLYFTYFLSVSSDSQGPALWSRQPWAHTGHSHVLTVLVRLAHSGLWDQRPLRTQPVNRVT